VLKYAPKCSISRNKITHPTPLNVFGVASLYEILDTFLSVGAATCHVYLCRP